MREDIGNTKTSSSRGRSTQRCIKQKRRPKFTVRKQGAKPATRKRDTIVMIC
jgi:hypothetical protein